MSDILNLVARSPGVAAHSHKEQEEGLEYQCHHSRVGHYVGEEEGVL